MHTNNTKSAMDHTMAYKQQMAAPMHPQNCCLVQMIHFGSVQFWAIPNDDHDAYVYIYIYIHIICMYASMYTCIHVSLCIYKYIIIYVYVYI